MTNLSTYKAVCVKNATAVKFQNWLNRTLKTKSGRKTGKIDGLVGIVTAAQNQLVK